MAREKERKKRETDKDSEQRKRKRNIIQDILYIFDFTFLLDFTPNKDNT